MTSTTGFSAPGPGDAANLVRVDLAGKRSELWLATREKFLDLLRDVMDSIIDKRKQTTVGDECAALTSDGLDYLHQLLRSKSLENSKVLAEVGKLYAEQLKIAAETRKTNAEADKIELENQIRRLRTALLVGKAIMVGDAGKEELILGNEILQVLEAALGEVGESEG